MKKVILSALAVMMFAFANAQEVRYGVKGGLNLSNFSGDTYGGNLKTKAGFNIGGFVEIKLSDKFTIQPEVLYSTQGPKAKLNKVDLGDGIFMTGFSFNLSYVNVPVMFKYYVADKFNVEAGPQLGFLTSAKAKTTIEGYNNGSVEANLRNLFNTIDFGLNLGLGYDFTDHLSAGARYNFGLANIAKTESGDNRKLHNEVFSINVGYKF